MDAIQEYVKRASQNVRNYFGAPFSRKASKFQSIVQDGKYIINIVLYKERENILLFY